MKTKTHQLFVFAGEHSGDLHGSHLIRELKGRLPGIAVNGVAGPLMRNQGVKGIFAMEDFEVMGFSDVIRALPKLYRQFYKVRDHILSTAPDAALLIDYPGFNLRMAQALRKKGYQGKIIQYVSPSVWAHGKHRIDTMVETLDLLMTIYPFESSCFDQTPLNVAYVGNPLCEYIKHYPYDNTWQKKISIPNTDRLIALFPGSRSSEIARNLPILLEAAAGLKEKHPETLFGVSCAHQATHKLLENAPKALKDVLFPIPKKYTYELMRDSRTAVAKSGTVTLELALHRRPTVVIYKLTALNRFYAQHILKLRLPHYCIVNILKNKTVFPELIEKGLSSDNLLHYMEALDNDGKTRYEAMKACTELRQELGSVDASASAAESITRLLSC